MKDPLTYLQQAIVTRLRAVPFLVDVPVFHERLKDVEAEIQKALGTIAGEGKAGIFALVLTPFAKAGGCEIPGQPYFDDVDLVVQIAENVLLNSGEQGTQKTAPAVALAIAAALHLHHEPGCFASLKTDLIKLVPHDSLVVYNISFKTALNATFAQD